MKALNYAKQYVNVTSEEIFYKVTKDKYKDMMDQNITKDYKKGDKEIIDSVNKGDKQIAVDLELEDRIYAFSERDAFLTIKDHKPNYMNNTKCRLINPAKSEMGKVSKIILSRIVKDLRKATKFNQWINSFSVATSDGTWNFALYEEIPATRRLMISNIERSSMNLKFSSSVR